VSFQPSRQEQIQEISIQRWLRNAHSIKSSVFIEIAFSIRRKKEKDIVIKMEAKCGQELNPGSEPSQAAFGIY
jgi:hypothetical protein